MCNPQIRAPFNCLTNGRSLGIPNLNPLLNKDQVTFCAKKKEKNARNKKLPVQVKLKYRNNKGSSTKEIPRIYFIIKGYDKWAFGELST